MHTITNAAVAASAMRLAKEFLLARESLEAMLAHLEDGGVLYLIRSAAQLALLTDLARDALREIGVANADVDAHLAVLEPVPEDRFFRGILVFLRPIDRASLKAPPGLVVAAPPAQEPRPLPTDERPFFHRMSDPVDDDARARLRIEGLRLAEAAVGWVGGLATLVAGLALLGPLLERTHRDAPGSAPWLYALNATASVATSALYAGLAPLVGLSGTTLLAGLCDA